MAGHHIGVCYYGDLAIKTRTQSHDFDGMLLLSIPCVTLLQLFSFKNLTFRLHVYVYIANTPYSVTVMHVVSIS